VLVTSRDAATPTAIPDSRARRSQEWLLPGGVWAPRHGHVADLRRCRRTRLGGGDAFVIRGAKDEHRCNHGPNRTDQIVACESE
jgi:hypothetical protein